jgi:hypothetical protein
MLCSAFATAMSALGSLADKMPSQRLVRFTPKAEALSARVFTRM